MKFLRNEKGSTMLLIVITIAILTVLGTTIITMSFMNTNMKFTDQRMKRTLYYSESGIEQVYAIVGKYIDEALYDASAETELEINTKETEMTTMLTLLTQEAAALYSDETEQQRLFDLYELKYASLGTMSLSEFMASGLYLKALIYDDLINPSPDYSGYADTFLMLQTEDAFGNKIEVDVENDINTAIYHGDHEILVDTQEISDYTIERMNHHYKEYFNDPTTQTDLLTDIGTVYVYLDPAEVNTGSTISLNPTRGYGSIVDFNEAASDAGLDDDIMIIDGVTSTFDYKGLTRKTISTDIMIRQPGDIVPLNLAQTKVEVENNPLWQYAIITHNDVVFDGSQANVNGSIYSLGNKPTGSYALAATHPDSPRNSNNYKGIMVDGSNANVTITGDVVSESYVQIAEGSVNATLNIADSHVYVNSMVIQEGSTNGAINVNNGNVYTRDDLELNGISASIDIDGSYYGFVGAALDFNQTSSVVINADLADSSLRITGNHANILFPETNDGIYIAGVSYINENFTPDPYIQDDSDSRLYQTGESLGIKGNYIAYAFPSTDPASEFRSDNLYTQAIGDTTGLPLYYRFVDAVDPLLPGDYMQSSKKAEYFKAIADDPTYAGIINNGRVSGVNKLNISTSDYVYTQGAVFGLDGALDPEVVIKNLNVATHITNFTEKEIARDYVYIMNTLRHRPDGAYGSNFFDATDSNVIQFIGNSEGATVINNYSEMLLVDYDFDKNVNINENVQGPAAGPGKEVAIVRSDTSAVAVDNFVIAGAGSGIVANDGDIIAYDMDNDAATPNENAYVINVDPDNNVLQGIILTSGKISMIGDVNFYGSIIAVEDIYIGDGNINLVNNDIEVRKYLARLILVNPDLKDALDVDTLTSVGLEMDSYEYIEDVVIGTGNIDALRQNYNEFIYYQNWRISE